MNAVAFGRQIEQRPLRRLETLLRWMEAVDLSEDMRALLHDSIEDLRDVTLELLTGGGLPDGIDQTSVVQFVGIGETEEEPEELTQRHNPLSGDDPWLPPLRAYRAEPGSTGAPEMPRGALLPGLIPGPDEPAAEENWGLAQAPVPAMPARYRLPTEIGDCIAMEDDSDDEPIELLEGGFSAPPVRPQRSEAAEEHDEAGALSRLVGSRLEMLLEG